MKKLFSILVVALTISTSLSDVVINLGARNIVCGYVGEDIPNVVFEGSVALPNLESDEIVVGIEAHNKYEDHTLVYPTSYIGFNNSDINHLNIIIEKCLRDLGNNTGMEVIPSDHRVMITGTLLNKDRTIRQKVAEVLFNEFHFTALNIQNSLLLGLQYSGRSTGLIINIDDDVSSLAAIYDGQIIHYKDLGYGQANAIRKVAEELYEDGTLGEEILGDKGYVECLNLYLRRCSVNTNSHVEILRSDNPVIQKYTLSNGQEIELRRVVFTAAELFINPAIAALEEGGIPFFILEIIRKCPSHMRSYLASNIILMGHGSKVDGLLERITMELAMNGPQNLIFKVRSFPENQFGGWLGAQTFASSPFYDQSMVTQEDYKSVGESIIN